ncbi:MAG: 30S ribosomal protein S25e [Desulfurococcaceae archaeon]
MSAQRAKSRKVDKKERAEESVKTGEGASLQTTVNLQEVIKRIEGEASKGTAKYYTPYTLAQAQSIKISDAKRALKEASNLGILRLHDAGRRSPIYIPVVKQKQSKEHEK